MLTANARLSIQNDLLRMASPRVKLRSLPGTPRRPPEVEGGGAAPGRSPSGRRPIDSGDVRTNSERGRKTAVAAMPNHIHASRHPRPVMRKVRISGKIIGPVGGPTCIHMMACALRRMNHLSTTPSRMGLLVRASPNAPRTP